MKNLIIILLPVFIAASSLAKSPGKFLKYRQVTDKEIIIESTKGNKVLFSAYDNNNIGISCFNKQNGIKLISPLSIELHRELNGSIYIEELDELIQITTTSNDGLLIKINKRDFTFLFINKVDQRELTLEDGLTDGLISNIQTLGFIADTAANSKTENPRLL